MDAGTFPFGQCQFLVVGILPKFTGPDLYQQLHYQFGYLVLHQPEQDLGFFTLHHQSDDQPVPEQLHGQDVPDLSDTAGNDEPYLSLQAQGIRRTEMVREDQSAVDHDRDQLGIRPADQRFHDLEHVEESQDGRYPPHPHQRHLQGIEILQPEPECKLQRGLELQIHPETLGRG